MSFTKRWVKSTHRTVLGTDVFLHSSFVDSDEHFETKYDDNGLTIVYSGQGRQQDRPETATR